MPSPPRFPAAAPGAGHYESYFAKLCHPEEPQAAWIRYTVHQRPGAAPTASLWCTLFDRSLDAPLAAKRTLPAEELGTGDDHYVHIGKSRIGPAAMVGEIAGDGPAATAASWDLRISGDAPPYRHLPRPWMYTGPLPRTKLLSPHPDATFDGRIAVGDREVDVTGWPGVIGHNWGSQHAERWSWLHGCCFAESPRARFDAALGRVRLGRVTTPWVGNGRLVLDGFGHVLGGMNRMLSTRVEESATVCDFLLTGRTARVAGKVWMPVGEAVGWTYADPDGSSHDVVHSSTARMSLVVALPGQPPVRLRTTHGATYELGMREHDHGVPIQPFPDGE